MASDSMRVRLHLRETRVLAVVSDTPSELRVEVEATANGATRSYRAFVAVVADPTGRWTVNAVGHRHPS